MLNLMTPSDLAGPTNAAVRSFLQHLETEMAERAEKVRMYREYYEGEQHSQLTDRMRAYLQLDSHQEFSANFMSLVVDGLANRLRVVGFDADDQTEVIWSWWRRNRMPAQHVDVHTMSIRDGEGFLLVEWNEADRIPRFTKQGAYDGRDGCTMLFDPASGRPSAGLKRWVEEGPNYRRRLNVYLPADVLKFRSSTEDQDVGWVPMGDPTPWVDGEGRPLGIPLVPFLNRPRGYNSGLSELDNAIPIQNGLNKAVIDLLAAADTDAFRLLTMTGDDPTDIKVSPGTVMYTLKKPGDASIGFIPSSDLRPQIEHAMQWAKMIAMITETPLHYFQISGQNPSEGAQQQQETRIISKAERASLDFGASWEEAMEIGRRLANTFGQAGLDEDQPIEVLWRDFEVRSKEDRALARAQIVQALTSSGATLAGALKTAGYAEAEIAEMVNAALDVLEP